MILVLYEWSVGGGGKGGAKGGVSDSGVGGYV